MELLQIWQSGREGRTHHILGICYRWIFWFKICPGNSGSHLEKNIWSFYDDSGFKIDVFQQMSALKERIFAILNKHLDEFTDIRRHIHKNPELSFEEYETQKFIIDRLDKWSISNYSIADTGVIAKIEGKNPQSKLIVLRADIDALPIKENSGLSFSSQNDGVMHACGHDVHTTCVLAAGRIIDEFKDEFEGTVKLLFQPGEEKLPGGATKVIAAGELDNPKPDLIIGQHVYPELEAGKLGFRPGLYMASSDEIYIDVKGPGGHGAMPERTIDVLKVASQLILDLKEFVDENAENSIPTVLTFGKIEGKGATNVIPKLVRIEGTFRTLDEDWRAKVHAEMESITKKLSADSGAEIELEIRKGYPCLINHEEATNEIRQFAESFLGDSNVIDLDLRMTSEDFAFYTQKYKCCFYRLGIKSPNGVVKNLHSPEFIVDERALETGVAFMVYNTLNILSD